MKKYKKSMKNQYYCQFDPSDMHEIEILAFYITSGIRLIMIYTKNFAETLYCDLQIRLNLGQNVRN